MEKNKNLLFILIALVSFLPSSAQEEKIIDFDELLSIRHSYSKNGDVKRLVIKDGKEKLVLSQKNMLKGKKFICDVIYECTEKLEFLPQINSVTELSDDIILLHGNYSFFGSVQHLIFYSRSSKVILKWVAYYSSYKTVYPSLVYFDETETVLFSNLSRTIYQNRMYAIDYEQNTFDIVYQTKSSMRLIQMGNYRRRNKNIRFGDDKNSMFFEFKIRD